MKKIIMTILIMFCSLLIVDNVQASKTVCQNQTHYYYFIYAPGDDYECSQVVNNLRIQVACDNANIIKKTAQDLWDEIKNGAQFTNNTSFNKTLIPNDYNVKSLQTEALTNFTKNDFYLLFDAFVTQGSLTENDVSNVKKTDTNYIYEEKSGNNTIYHHLYGNFSEEVTDNNVFLKMKPYFDTLTTEQKITYREQIVNSLFNAQLPSTAVIGIGNSESFNPLTEDNLNLIFDEDSKVAIQREVKSLTRSASSISVEPMYYYNGSALTRNITYITPAKVEVVVETSCQEQTCEQINQEYDGCKDSTTCSSDLIAEYEKCNPLQEIANPRTTDLNITLVILVIMGTFVIGFATYQSIKTD